MKKLILIMIVFGLYFNGITQNQYKSVKDVLRPKDDIQMARVKENLSQPKLNYNKSTNEDINRIVVGISGNQRSFRREETHVISYNPELDVISATFILDPYTYNGVDYLSSIGQFYSVDHGQTWQGPVLLADHSDQGLQNYYPSGIIYNPTGNTVVTSACGVAQSTNSNWNYKVYGSSTLAGENYTTYLYEDTDPDYTYNGYWNQFGLNQYGNEVRCMNVAAEGDWGNFTAASLQPIYASYSNNTFNWDFSSLIEMNLSTDNEGVMHWIGMFGSNDAGAEMVWSDNGQIGYVWMVGVYNAAPSGYQPIIFKTSDSGNTWDLILLDFFTTDMQNYLSSYLTPNWTGLYAPYTFESVGIVDYNGDLQLFAAIKSHSKDFINYPDSISWYFEYPGDLFNITVDNNGIKDILWIDSFKTKNVTQDDEGSYNGTGWQHRLSAARNNTEEQVFITWLDTPDNISYEFNTSPDIFGWSKSCLPNGEMMPTPICFTEYTLYEGFYYFTYGAEKAFLNGDGNYTIPYLQAVTPGEFATNGSATSDPVTVNYITGIEFSPLSGDDDDQCAIFINPTTQTVNTNEIFSTTIEIADVLNLGSFELVINFDPAYLQANSVTIGDFLGSTGRSLFPLEENIDNANGLIEFAVTTLGAAPPGPDGDGVLLSIEWVSAASVATEVTTNLILQTLQITEPNGTVIPISSQNGSVTISTCYIHDFDCDCDVDIVDVTMAAYRYGTSTGDPNYDPAFDLDSDGDIDIVDITMVTYDYGWTCGKSNTASINLNNVNNENVVIEFSPNGIINNADGTYDIELFVENIEQFGGYELELSFNPKALEVLSIEQGNLIESTNRTIQALQNVIDNKTGRIYYSIATLGSQIDGASGNGTLLKIKCKSLNSSIETLDLIKAQLVRIDAKVINYSFKSNEIDLANNGETYIISTYPSPFKINMTIQYAVGQEGKVAFKLYNVFGGLLKTSEQINMTIGNFNKAFGQEGLSAGVYIITLELNDRVVDSKRVIVN